VTVTGEKSGQGENMKNRERRAGRGSGARGKRKRVYGPEGIGRSRGSHHTADT